MTKDEEAACAALRDACDLKDPGEIDVYVRALEALRGSSSSEVLRQMLLCLRDTDAGEIQYELVEACEAYPDQQYVDTFLEVGLDVERRSPKWFELMFQSILNSRSCRSLAIDGIRRMPASARAAYRAIVDRITLHTPKYKDVVAEL